jgi:hypothetical protein
MNRQRIGEAEIERETLDELRGEMAVVADTDACGEELVDGEQLLPDTVREPPMHVFDESPTDPEHAEEPDSTSPLA